MSRPDLTKCRRGKKKVKEFDFNLIIFLDFLIHMKFLVNFHLDKGMHYPKLCQIPGCYIYRIFTSRLYIALIGTLSSIPVMPNITQANRIRKPYL